MSDAAAANREVTLLELLDRVIDHGVVLTGDITISVADVELIYLGLKLMLAPVERVQEYRAALENAPGREAINA